MPHHAEPSPDENNLLRIYSSSGWYLQDTQGKQRSERFGYIEPWGTHCYRVERGVRSNILRPDGTLVLHEWPHRVGHVVEGGFFTIGETIPKNATHPKTLYLEGLAHTSGTVLFPPLFNTLEWADNHEYLYAEIGTRGYLIFRDGSLSDMTRDHLPRRTYVDNAGYTHTEDNFPYLGVKDNVCEGCIYAGGIVGNGAGCGRLFIKSFRERYAKGYCEFRKESLTKPSRYEEQVLYDKQCERELRAKQSDTFALALVHDFIDEFLGGDINRLLTFDLTLRSDNLRYFDPCLQRTPIVRALVALLFGHAHPELNVASIEKYTYMPQTIIHSLRLLGSNINDKYLNGLQRFDPSPELHARALNAARLTGTIGNLWVLPSVNMGHFNPYSVFEDPRLRHRIDRFLPLVEEALRGADKLKRSPRTKAPDAMGPYKGPEGYRLWIKAMLLDDYVDASLHPLPLLPDVWLGQRGLDRDTYLQAVDQFCLVCETIIPQRGQRLTARLQAILYPTSQPK